MAGSWYGNAYYGDATNETVDGTANNDRLFGAEGEDVLRGLGGDDNMDGGVGNDILEGGAGNDQLTDVGSVPFGFVGLIGRDNLKGGDGQDTLSFFSIDTGDFADGGSGVDELRIWFDYNSADTLPGNARINFTLGPGGATSIVRINGINSVTVSGMERMFFRAGNGDNTLRGGDLDDTLVAGSGNDHLYGGDGNDSIDGGAGIQDLNGGAGFDGVSFDVSGFAGPMTITNAAVLNLGAAGSVRNFEFIDEVTSGNDADVYSITQDRSILITSGAGDDQITVGDGGSAIYAGIGADIITTGAGGDDIDGGSGANRVRMGAGDDTYSHETSRAYLEGERILGEAGNDAIYTAAGADTSYGGTGNDTVYTGQGNDQAFGGAGNDQIEGEHGLDSLYGGEGDDRISSDYDYYAEADLPEHDVLDGGAGNDTLDGGIGDDSLYGGAGNDRLAVALTRVENDVEIQDTGYDHIFGGAGVDTLSTNGLGLNFPNAKLEIILAATTLIKVNGVAVAEATSVEALDVTHYALAGAVLKGGAFSDFATLGAGNDQVFTYGGNDRITAGKGSDTVNLGAGDDTLGLSQLGGVDRFFGGAGNDVMTVYAPYLSEGGLPAGLGLIDGGAGTDRLVLYAADRQVRFNGTAIFLDGIKIATVTGFENVELRGASKTDSLVGTANADTLMGDAGNDTLTGLAGDDSLDGGNDSDLLYGGAGNDQLYAGNGFDSQYGGNGDDSLNFAADNQLDLISGGAGEDFLRISALYTYPVVMTGDVQTGATVTINGILQANVSGVERINSTGSTGNDILIGGTGNDSLGGGSGADVLYSGLGDDSVSLIMTAGQTDLADLGGGTDMITISVNATGALNLKLAADMTLTMGGVSLGHVLGAEIMEVFGGNFDDTLTGGALNDELVGGLGANILTGNAGDDAFGVSIDALTDKIYGGKGNDMLSFYGGGTEALRTQVSAAGVFQLKQGTATVATATSIESLVIYGSGGNDSLTGLKGSDSLYGNFGDDVLKGGAGNDLLAGDSGSDSLTGGLGSDSFQFTAPSETSDTITDFAAGDILRVSRFGFGLTLTSPVLLVQGTDPLPAPGSLAGVFLYDTDTGLLQYDFDGEGVRASHAIAYLLNAGVAATLTESQILIF